MWCHFRVNKSKRTSASLCMNHFYPFSAHQLISEKPMHCIGNLRAQEPHSANAKCFQEYETHIDAITV